MALTRVELRAQWPFALLLTALAVIGLQVLSRGYGTGPQAVFPNPWQASWVVSVLLCLPLVAESFGGSKRQLDRAAFAVVPAGRAHVLLAKCLALAVYAAVACLCVEMVEADVDRGAKAIRLGAPRFGLVLGGALLAAWVTAGSALVTRNVLSATLLGSGCVAWIGMTLMLPEAWNGDTRAARSASYTIVVTLSHYATAPAVLCTAIAGLVVVTSVRGPMARATAGGWVRRHGCLLVAGLVLWLSTFGTATASLLWSQLPGFRDQGQRFGTVALSPSGREVCLSLWSPSSSFSAVPWRVDVETGAFSRLLSSSSLALDGGGLGRVPSLLDWVRAKDEEYVVGSLMHPIQELRTGRARVFEVVGEHVRFGDVRSLAEGEAPVRLRADVLLPEDAGFGAFFDEPSDGSRGDLRSDHSIMALMTPETPGVALALANDGYLWIDQRLSLCWELPVAGLSLVGVPQLSADGRRVVAGFHRSDGSVGEIVFLPETRTSLRIPQGWRHGLRGVIRGERLAVTKVSGRRSTPLSEAAFFDGESLQPLALGKSLTNIQDLDGDRLLAWSRNEGTLYVLNRDGGLIRQLR